MGSVISRTDHLVVNAESGMFSSFAMDNLTGIRLRWCSHDVMGHDYMKQSTSLTNIGYVA